MKSPLFLIFLISIFASCQNPDWSDENVEKKALNITKILDSTQVKIFYKWNFTQRGTGFWSKVGSRDSSYWVWYNDTGNVISLAIGSHEIHKFIKDFSLNFEADTAKFNRFYLNLEDERLHIKGNENGQEIYIANTLRPSLIFKGKNPFRHFEALSNLKDSLGCYDIIFWPEKSNAIIFRLSPQHLLIYIPDNLTYNPQWDSKAKQDWINHVNKGKKLNKNWILRKLDKPLTDPF